MLSYCLKCKKKKKKKKRKTLRVLIPKFLQLKFFSVKNLNLLKDNKHKIFLVI